MVETTYIYPLKLPNDHKLAPIKTRRFDSGFPSVTLNEAVQYLQEEIDKLPMDRVIVYTNYERMNSERLRRKGGDDPAVCLELSVGIKKYYMACSTWSSIEHNLYALHLTLRAIQNIEKWGVTDLESLLQSFGSIRKTEQSAATEEEKVMLAEWMQTLGLDTRCTLEDANAAYRNLAKQNSSNEDALLKLNKAVEAARKHFGAK